MTRREQVAQHRGQILRLAERHGFTRPRLFGSVARGDDDEASDVDLLVTRVPGADPFALLDLREELERLLGCRVDVLVEHPLMRPRLRDRVLREAVAL
jgi:hypothetical protein